MNFLYFIKFSFFINENIIYFQSEQSGSFFFFIFEQKIIIIQTDTLTYFPFDRPELLSHAFMGHGRFPMVKYSVRFNRRRDIGYVIIERRWLGKLGKKSDIDKNDLFTNLRSRWPSKIVVKIYIPNGIARHK